MKKKILLSACATLIVASLQLAEAQQAKKVPRIGYLAADSRAPTRDSFRQGLKDLGYVEGQSILIEWRFAEGKSERFPEYVSELVRLKLDVGMRSRHAGSRARLRRSGRCPPG